MSKPLPRGLLFLSYLFMCISAVMSFFVPLASFQLLSLAIWIYIWAGCLTAGGLMGAIAALLRKTGFELIAITLLLTGYLAYSVILGVRLAQVVSQGHPETITGSLFIFSSIMALALLLARRWYELWKLVRMPLVSPGGQE
jgi:hypothetical protein